MTHGSSRPPHVARPDLRLIDLFCGAGGLTLGFTRSDAARFTSVWANDMNPSAASTYAANFGPHCTTADLSERLGDSEFEVPHADVVIGGPAAWALWTCRTRHPLWMRALQAVALLASAVYWLR